MRNALAASKPDTVLVADDATAAFPLVRKFWRLHIVLGSVREASCEQFWTTEGRRQLKGWCVGTVQPWAVGPGGAAKLEAAYQARLRTRTAEMQTLYDGALEKQRTSVRWAASEVRF